MYKKGKNKEWKAKVAKTTNPGSDAQDNKNQAATSKPTERAGKTCHWCSGSWPHPEGKTCPAWELPACRNCGEKGHFQVACRSSPKKNDTSRVGKRTVEKEVGEVVCWRIASTAVHDDSAPIPMMKDVKIEPINKKMNTKPTVMEVFPDSDSQETLVSTDLMDYLGLELNKRRKKHIKGIDGKTYVPCLGSSKFQVTYNGQQTNVLALATSGLSNEVVLSWRTLQWLGVLPEDNPRSLTRPMSKFQGNQSRVLKITKAWKSQVLLVRSPRRC